MGAALQHGPKFWLRGLGYSAFAPPVNGDGKGKWTVWS